MMEGVDNVLDPSAQGLTSECDLPLEIIIKEELDTEDFEDVQHQWNIEISVDNMKEEIEEFVDTDVHPERGHEVQDVIVGPSTCTTHSVEEGPAYQNLTSSNTNSTADDNYDNIEISANEISLIRRTNRSKGTKQFSCDTCQKRFNCESKLTRHVRTHTGEKPYKCSDCMKCYREKDKLKLHMRTHTGYKPYKCSDCMKCFSVNSSLIMHMRIHTGYKPYKCSDCKKCFSVKTSLLTHIRTHTGEKPYQCIVCTKCFSDRSSLVRHNRIHGNDVDTR